MSKQLINLRPGDEIAGYLILDQIGSGALGVVYEAQNKLISRKAAIKVLYPWVCEEEDQLQRFLREAKIASSLDHPHIVRVFDVGEENGLYYMVMEYVEGSNLKEVVSQQGPFSPRRALRIIRQVAEALLYIHKKELVHRDVKPANILLDKNGNSKLVDFGLVRSISQDTELTAPGTLVGTPVYMSPEQCSGRSIDHRSDLYSLGVTLYFLVSGVLPYKDSDPLRLIHKAIHDPPVPLETVAPEVPSSVKSIVQRLMAKEPRARFQSAEELISAIDEALAGRPEKSTLPLKPQEPESSQIPWIVIIGLGLFSAVLTWAFLNLQKPSYALSKNHTELRKHSTASRTQKREGLASDLSGGGTARSPGSNRPLSEPDAEVIAVINPKILAKQFEALKKTSSACVRQLALQDSSSLQAFVSRAELASDLREIMNEMGSHQGASCRFYVMQKAPGEGQTFILVEEGKEVKASYVLNWQLKEGTWRIVSIGRK